MIPKTRLVRKYEPKKGQLFFLEGSATPVKVIKEIGDGQFVVSFGNIELAVSYLQLRSDINTPILAPYLGQGYIREEEEEEEEPPPEGDTEPEPGAGIQSFINESGVLNTSLNGLALPSRPISTATLAEHYADNLANGASANPRWWLYYKSIPDWNPGTEVSDYEWEVMEGATSSGFLLKGKAGVSDYVLKNFIFCGSYGDAIKYEDYGTPLNVTLDGFHVYGLGYAGGAHADSFQNDNGGFLSLTFKNGFLDAPTNAGDGTRANANLQIDGEDGFGPVTVESCILRGGNFNVIQNAAVAIHFDKSAFIVEEDSPRYGFSNVAFGNSTFGVGNAVYYHNKITGLCEFLTTDVANFDFQAWHQNLFGRAPAN